MVEAIILVGGFGTRLRPLTIGEPKAMLPLAGHPFLSHQIAALAAGGVDRVVLALGFRPDAFIEHYGSEFRVPGAAGDMPARIALEYVTEDTPLGTAGAMRNASTKLTGGADDLVVILNGDILGDHDLAGQLGLHARHGADVSLHLVGVDDPRAFGCVPTDESDRVTAFLEKSPDPVTDQVNAGCYVFRRSVLDQIPAGRAVSVERETFPHLLDAGAVVVGHRDDGYWLDLGTPATWVKGSCDLVRGVVRSPLLPDPPGEALVLPGADVSSDAVVCGGSTVGRHCVVKSGAVIGASVLGDGCHIGPEAQVRNALLGPGVSVGDGCVLTKVVIGANAVIGAGCELTSGARIWPSVTIPPGAIRFSPDI